MLQLDDFVYDTDALPDGPESPLLYQPGGYHPVTLGNVISSPKTRYHVVHKLGWGGYATVWLVQDLSSYAWLALRIRMANDGSKGEDEVLRRISSMPHSQHLPVVHDMFTIEGPNGKHICMATDVVVPLSESLLRDSSIRHNAKVIVSGIVEAVAHIHKAGIIHGDLHMGNVGLAVTLRGDDAHADYPLRCPLEFEPEMTAVVASTTKALAMSSHLPSYLVSPISIGRDYDLLHDANEPHIVKLFDFGNAHLEKKPRTTNGFLADIAPPEWAIAQTPEHKPDITLSTASDIWALGILIFEVMSGGGSIFSRSRGVLPQIAALAGSIPTSWNAFPAVKYVNVHEISPADSNRRWEEHRATIRKTGMSDEDADALIALLRRILVLDPTARPNAEEILRDPWFSIVSQNNEMLDATPPTVPYTGAVPHHVHLIHSRSHFPQANPYGPPNPCAYPPPYGAFPAHVQHSQPPLAHTPVYGYPFHFHSASSPVPPLPPPFPMGSGTWFPPGSR
ncbi:unnamed protein product [Peniophora sp. CBMAI 1063]|nr:unnamed protein product [Peniophora sp. CBMAI 1063]